MRSTVTHFIALGQVLLGRGLGAEFPLAGR